MATHPHRLLLAESLADGLDDRVTVQQAAGVLAARTGTTVVAAEVALRRHAERHDLLLADVATDVLDGSLEVDPGP